MGRTVIAVDIDEVLSPLHSLFILHHNDVYGTNYEAPDPSGRYFLNQITNESAEKTLKKLKLFVDSESFQAIKPLEGSVRAIEHLAGKHELVIITSRQDFYEELTYSWLEKYFPELFQSVHFTAHVIGEGPRVSKSAIARQLDADYMIDDNLDFASEAARAGLKVILFGDYSWNQAKTLPAGVTRCKDWAAVMEYFDGRG